MSDNVEITEGANATPAGGTQIATDEISGKHYQRVKVVLGADGAADMDVDSGQQTKANSVPVTLASDQIVQISAADDNSVARNVHCDDEGVLITEDHHDHSNHLGKVYQISSFFGETANGGETNLLIQCGANKDLHMISLEALTDGYWELEVFEGPEFTAAGTSIKAHVANRFLTTASDHTWTATPTLVSTTVDANSGASETGVEDVLNVTATTNFVVGTWVLIEKGNERECTQIASIQAGVSLTMESDLIGSYVNTDTVESSGERIAFTHTEGGEKAKSGAAGATAGGEWIYKSGEDYLLRMTNKAGSAKRSSNIIWWLEEDKQT